MVWKKCGYKTEEGRMKSRAAVKCYTSAKWKFESTGEIKLTGQVFSCVFSTS